MFTDGNMTDVSISYLSKELNCLNTKFDYLNFQREV